MNHIKKGEYYEIKKILALILVLSTTSALSFSSMAEEVSLLDSLPAVQYEVETRGNAETLSEDDYLLDGNYEMVN